jgi:fructokinase
MHDILVAGEMLIDFLPDDAGRLKTVDTFSRRPGGAPTNVAVGMARLDATPLLWTRVGDDPFGEFLVETLETEGIPLEFVHRDPDAKTSLAFVSLGEDADREFSFYRDGTADTRMQPGQVDDETLSGVDWVHAGGVTLTDEPSREATYDLLERAAERGATVSFDPNARAELWDEFDYGASIRRAFESADVVKTSVEDLQDAGLDGDAPEELARELCAMGPHTVFVTLGGSGSYAYATEDAPWSGVELEATHGGYDVEPVDTTGAGDAFTAGAIVALQEGQSLEEALGFANAVAAQATTAPGAMTALPDRETVRSFQARQRD